MGCCLRNGNWFPSKTAVLCGRQEQFCAGFLSGLLFKKKFLRKEAVPSVFSLPAHFQNSEEPPDVLPKHDKIQHEYGRLRLVMSAKFFLLHFSPTTSQFLPSFLNSFLPLSLIINFFFFEQTDLLIDDLKVGEVHSKKNPLSWHVITVRPTSNVEIHTYRTHCKDILLFKLICMHWVRCMWSSSFEVAAIVY